jgi:hypothetical protein
MADIEIELLRTAITNITCAHRAKQFEGEYTLPLSAMLKVSLQTIAKHSDFLQGLLSALPRQEEELQENAPAEGETLPGNKYAIEVRFDAAKRNGFMKPSLRAGDYLFKAAPMYGNNPGAVYITRISNNEYLGKLKDKQLTLAPHARNEAGIILQIAQNPEEEAIKYGQQTGECSICGRTLTNKESLERMIGPICAEKMGF